MTSPAPDIPYQGRFVGRAHHFALHVYFEDTDFSGLVYHANYLRYMERARSDMVARIGVDQKEAFASGFGVYAVADLWIRYLRPARFDDDLLVMSTVEEFGAARLVIHQRVMRGEELLSDARVVAAFLSPEGRPKRQPKHWMDAMKTLLPEKKED
jgi:acyl-CoA thioester hydrolase